MKIVVNHLTRMQSGYLCIAGVDVQTKRHVRAIPARGNLRPELLARHGGPLDMGMILELGPARPTGQPPETEDHEFDQRGVQALGVLAGPRFWNMVTQMARPSLAALFGEDLVRRGALSYAVDVGKGIASLGCITPHGRPELLTRARDNKPPQLRMRFSDETCDIDVSVTDLRLFDDRQVSPNAEAVDRVARRLQNEDAILSVGLTRAFASTPDKPPLHWLQVNNIHFQDDPVWQFA